uniref:Sodium-coupled monocarboxylate transporter 1 n=1 Tax=Timema bartmani TaxID=61472 RepID=A0A7R9F0E3_9NEOP|nr:unnamed protein product [Timema bartmani]
MVHKINTEASEITMAAMNMTSEDYEPIWFDWLDHSVFALMLGVSTLVGVFIGLYGKQDTKVDYLLGGKVMNTLPVAVSLVASHLSGITLMGVPSEIYLYGLQYFTMVISVFIMTYLINYVYLPVFFSLQLTSTFEYLELRFNQNVRVIASAIFTISMVLFLPIVVYIPALAFSQVSGVNIHFITPTVSLICIVYTMMGGLKAVVWTDFLQSFVTLGSCIAVIFLGVSNVGGVIKVFEISYHGGRTNMFNMDPSPFARNTFWTVSVGMTFLQLCHCGINQGMVQKFLALPTIQNARRSLYIFSTFYIIMKALSCFIGLLIYSSYHDCDPIRTKRITRADQILPYFVMHTAEHIPGLPGLFVAGIFSAALSTMSSTLNSLAGTIFEDFVQPAIRGTRLSNHATLVLRAIVLGVGTISVLMVFVVEKLGGVLEGALSGSIISVALMSWIMVGAQHAIAAGKKHPHLPTSVAGCDNSTSGWQELETTTKSYSFEYDGSVFFLYRISYLYYTLVGTMTVMIVGGTVSYFTGPKVPHKMDKRLFAPFLHNFMALDKDDLVSIDSSRYVTSLVRVLATSTMCVGVRIKVVEGWFIEMTKSWSNRRPQQELRDLSHMSFTIQGSFTILNRNRTTESPLPFDTLPILSQEYTRHDHFAAYLLRISANYRPKLAAKFPQNLEHYKSAP